MSRRKRNPAEMQPSQAKSQEDAPATAWPLVTPVLIALPLLGAIPFLPGLSGPVIWQEKFVLPDADEKSPGGLTSQPLTSTILAWTGLPESPPGWRVDRILGLGLHVLATVLLLALLWRVFSLAAGAGSPLGTTGLLAAAGTAVWAVHPLQCQTVLDASRQGNLLLAISTFGCLLGLVLALTRRADRLDEATPVGEADGETQAPSSPEDRPSTDPSYNEAKAQTDLDQGSGAGRQTDARGPGDEDGRVRRIWLVVSVAFAAVGITSHLAALVLPLLVLAVEAALPSISWGRHHLTRMVFHLGLGLMYLYAAAALTWLRDAPSTDGWEIAALSRTTFLINQPGIWLQDLGRWIWPRDLPIGELRPPAVGWLPWVVGPSMAFLGVALAYSVAKFRSLVGLLGLLILMPLLACSITSAFPGDLVFTRLGDLSRFYLASAGLCLVLVLAIVAVLRLLRIPPVTASRLAGVMLLGWAVFLAVQTSGRATDFRSAEVLWEKTVQVQPNNARALSHLAALQSESRPGEARKHLTRLIELRPRLAFPRIRLARLLAADGQHDRAERMLRLAVESHPRQMSARVELGQRLIEQEKWGEVIGEFQQVLQSHSSPKFHLYLGIALLKEGWVLQAIEHLQRAVAELPDSPSAHEHLGAALLEAKRVDEALPSLQKAVSLRPSSANNHHNLAVALYALSENKDIAEVLRHEHLALKADPYHVNAWLNLGWIHAGLGQTQVAAEHFQQAAKVAPKNWEAHRALATMLLDLGDWRPARRALTEVLRLRPGHLNTLQDLGWLLCACEDPQLRDGRTALKLATRLTKVRPQDPGSWDLLAAAHAENGDFLKATQAADQAIDLALSQKNQGLVQDIQQRRLNYQNVQPFRLKVFLKR